MAFDAWHIMRGTLRVMTRDPSAQHVEYRITSCVMVEEGGCFDCASAEEAVMPHPTQAPRKLQYVKKQSPAAAATTCGGCDVKALEEKGVVVDADRRSTAGGGRLVTTF